MNEPVGTPYYIAPDILNGDYTEIVDMWALGVVLYMMISGLPPFNGDNNKEIIKAIKKGLITFSHNAFRYSSLEVKDLIAKLIQRNPKKRLTAERAF